MYSCSSLTFKFFWTSPIRANWVYGLNFRILYRLSSDDNGSITSASDLGVSFGFETIWISIRDFSFSFSFGLMSKHWIQVSARRGKNISQNHPQIWLDPLSDFSPVVGNLWYLMGTDWDRVTIIHYPSDQTGKNVVRNSIKVSAIIPERRGWHMQPRWHVETS